MPLILQPGYEDAVRAKLGVKPSELPDSDINQRVFVDVAEAYVIRRVPRYQEVTDPTDLLMLESAVISYICYLLAPSMARRVNRSVSTIDVRWEKDRVDWEQRAQEFLAECETALSSIQSVPVETGYESRIFMVAKATDGDEEEQ